MRESFKFLGVTVRFIKPYRARKAVKLLIDGAVYALLPDGSVGTNSRNAFTYAHTEYTHTDGRLAEAMRKLGAIDGARFKKYNDEYLRRAKASDAREAASRLNEAAAELGFKLTAAQQKRIRSAAIVEAERVPA